MMLPESGCDPKIRQKVLEDIEKLDDYQVNMLNSNRLINVAKLKRRLKNRMSAQAARERKKARMDELERQLSIVSDRLRRVELENYYLRDRLNHYEPQDPFQGKTIYS